MELTQVKGNTWVAEGTELIPFYKLDGKRCVLLDSGLLEEREELEAALGAAGLTPAGVLCSHAHVDHCGNNRYFQERYGAQIALTAPEAGMCANQLTLKCYFLTISPDMIARESAHLVHTPDVVLPPEDGPVSFCGARFHILHTPGHSAGHICTITPDNVCYTADAMLSPDLLDSKLPYSLSHQVAGQSREKLRTTTCDAYILAHRGICGPGEIDGLIDDNQDLIARRLEEILALVHRPMTMSQIGERVCTLYELFTHKPRRSLRFERNVRFFVECLADQGRLELLCRNGTTYYRRPERERAPLAPPPTL